ncbi:MAG: polyisoprenoid-binding protein [Deltaproteobacteria bacterium]|nr:polyisoprenoid-binding protein [Deltaproteobacteria bacterium]
MRKILMILSLLLLSSTASAEDYTVDTRHTFPSFEVNHMGLSTQRGRFDATGGAITLDSAAKTGTVLIEIDAASVNTGLKELEKHLKGEDFFNVEKHPKIIFRSDKMEFDGDRPKALHGELTLLGVTKPVTLSISSFNCRIHPMNKKFVCGADASTTIRRSEFGMGYAIPAVSDEVKLSIQIEAFRN